MYQKKLYQPVISLTGRFMQWCTQPEAFELAELNRVLLEHDGVGRRALLEEELDDFVLAARPDSAV